MNPARFLDDVIQDLGRRQLAVFCGAGISLRSGVPIVGPLVSTILESLGVRAPIIDTISSSGIPFESIIEVLASEVSIARLLDVFDADHPNANHHLIARLSAGGLIGTVITTNFDELIEQALDVCGSHKGTDYIVAASPDEFSRLDWADTRIKLIKLHGTIRDKDRLGVTLRAIAAGSAVGQMADVMKQALQSQPIQSVLVLGYSCSDVFDITPAIESCAPSSTRILFLEHSNSTSWNVARVEPVGQRFEKNPFRDYRGERLFADTGDVVAYLWKTFFPKEAQPDNESKSRPKWAPIVAQWASEALAGDDASLGPRVTASLLMHIDEYLLAREELEVAVSVSDSVELLSRLAYIYQMDGKLQKAADLYAEAANTSRATKDIVGFLQYGGSLAEVTRLMGRAEEAKNLLQENQKTLDRVAEEHPDVRAIAMGLWSHVQSCQLIYLGNTYVDLGCLDEAVRSYERARDLAVSSGDKIVEANSLGALGRLLRLQRHTDEAEQADRRGRQIAQEIGSPALVRKIRANLLQGRVSTLTDEERETVNTNTGRPVFEKTNHESRRTQSELLMQFMELMEESSALGREESIRRLEALQDRELTCWECGSVFPLLHGLGRPPVILRCPGCSHPLAAYREAK